MVKRMLLLTALCAVVLLTACIDSTTVISVRKDGSGIVTETTYLNDSMKAMMQNMAGMFGEEAKQEAEKDEPINIDELKEKAAKLGEGVTFVSAKEVKNEEGAKGVEVVYAFEDIRKLNIDAKPDNPMGDEMAGMMGAEASEESTGEEVKNPITFDFEKGRSSKLIVHIPKEEEKEAETEFSETESETDEEQPSDSDMQMMQQMFKGFRIRIMVNLLEGKLEKTNASFVEKVNGKETVTLFDFNLGDIMGKKEYMDQLKALEKMKDMDKAMEEMKKIPGLKIETKEKVEIQFR